MFVNGDCTRNYLIPSAPTPPHPVSSAKSVWFEETISNKEVKIIFFIHASTSTQHTQYLIWYTGPTQATYTGHFVYGLYLTS